MSATKVRRYISDVCSWPSALFAVPHGNVRDGGINGRDADIAFRVAIVEGFGCRLMATMRLAPGPASESLQ
jgi:hypothetical protein